MLPARRPQRAVATLHLSAVAAIVVLTFVGQLVLAAVVAVVWLVAMVGGYVQEKRKGKRYRL